MKLYACLYFENAFIIFDDDTFAQKKNFFLFFLQSFEKIFNEFCNLFFEMQCF